jgi:hypothetical protein
MDESSQSSSDSSPSSGRAKTAQSGPSANLTARQLQAADLEARGASKDQISKKLGIGRTTVQRWRTKPEYRAEVVRLVREFSRALDRMALGLGASGLKALSAVIADPNAKPGEKAAAARALVDAALKISARTTEAEADREAAEEEKLSAIRPPRNLTFSLMKPQLPESTS